MTAIRVPEAYPVLEDVDELVAVVDERVSTARQSQRAPVSALVGRIQLQLGVRVPPEAATYGPTSHCSEASLFFAYRNTGPARDDNAA